MDAREASREVAAAAAAEASVRAREMREETSAWAEARARRGKRVRNFIVVVGGGWVGCFAGTE